MGQFHCRKFAKVGMAYHKVGAAYFIRLITNPQKNILYSVLVRENIFICLGRKASGVCDQSITALSY